MMTFRNLLIRFKETILLFTVLTAISLFTFRTYLVKSAEKFGSNFRAQNVKELENADTYGLILRINSLIPTIHWTCIKLEKSGSTILLLGDKCYTSFFVGKTRVVSKSDPSFAVTFWIRLSEDQETLFLMFYFFQILTVGLFAYYTNQATKKIVAKDSQMIFLARQVAHDIRSPLMALEMAAEDLSQMNEDQKTLLKSAIDRIRDISQELLQKNKAPNHKIESPPNKHPTFIVGAVEAIVAEKRLETKNRKNVEISLVKQDRCHLLFTKMEAQDLKRILSNLINNSVEAIKESRGMISVEVAHVSDAEFTISVADNGIGIPEDILSSIGLPGVTFGKEHLGDAGTGLGLAHAKSTVAKYGGRLEISTKRKIGTTVNIILPRIDPPSWFVTKLDLQSVSQIVILDNDPSIFQIWQRKLEATTLPIRYFSSTAEFEQQLSSFSENTLFLIDFDLGEQTTGIDVINKFNLERRSTLVSSFADIGILAERCNFAVAILPKDNIRSVELS